MLKNSLFIIFIIILVGEFLRRKTAPVLNKRCLDKVYVSVRYITIAHRKYYCFASGTTLTAFALFVFMASESHCLI